MLKPILPSVKQHHSFIPENTIQKPHSPFRREQSALSLWWTRTHHGGRQQLSPQFKSAMFSLSHHHHLITVQMYGTHKHQFYCIIQSPNCISHAQEHVLIFYKSTITQYNNSKNKHGCHEQQWIPSLQFSKIVLHSITNTFCTYQHNVCIRWQNKHQSQIDLSKPQVRLQVSNQCWPAKRQSKNNNLSDVTLQGWILSYYQCSTHKIIYIISLPQHTDCAIQTGAN